MESDVVLVVSDQGKPVSGGGLDSDAQLGG